MHNLITWNCRRSNVTAFDPTRCTLKEVAGQLWAQLVTMATQIPQAGTRMSLISKADIRYEGVLSHIDMAKSEICLTQGMSKGCWPSFTAQVAAEVAAST